jgi:hypothetical protein
MTDNLKNDNNINIHKCKCGESRSECFSNIAKEKRCRECLKKAKNSPNKKPPNLDTESTDTTHSNWQGGKYGGTVFQRRSDENGIIVCVSKKQKRFRFAEYDDDKAKTELEAQKYRKKLSDELEQTTNKYKVISIDGKPTYLIVRLSQYYCTLMDYKYLDFVKNNNLFVSKGGNEEANYYCRYQESNSTKLFHRYVLGILDAGDKILGDHINRYTLDNRECNLRVCNHGGNNANRSVINSRTYIEKDGKYHGTIVYMTNPAQPKRTAFKKFDTLDKVKQWIIKRSKEIDDEYSNISDESKRLAKEFEDIMDKYADDYKWNDWDQLENIAVSVEKNKKVEKKIEEISYVTTKKEIYNKFKLINPDFEITSDILTPDRKIHHLQFNGVAYKYCSKCDKWIKTSDFYANAKNYDNLDRRCKKCKKASKEENKEIEL